MHGKFFLGYQLSIKYNQNVIAPNNISIVVNSYTILFIVFILYSLYSLYKYNTKWLYVSRLFCFLLLSLTAENPVPSDNTTRRKKLLLINSLIILSTVPITVMFILIDHHSLYLLTFNAINILSLFSYTLIYGWNTVQVKPFFKLFLKILLSLTDENPPPSDNSTKRNKLLFNISLTIPKYTTNSLYKSSLFFNNYGVCLISRARRQTVFPKINSLTCIRF